MNNNYIVITDVLFLLSYSGYVLGIVESDKINRMAKNVKVCSKILNSNSSN